MRKGTMKLLAQILVVAMIAALLPAGLTVSAVTGNVINITVNPNRPVANTGGNQIKVASTLTNVGNYTYGDRTTMTFAHMGTKLKGKTQILVPVNDSTRANPTNPPSVNTAMQNFLNSTQEYFNFTADQPGAVLVVSNTNLHNSTDSRYKNNYASWNCVANGVYAAPPSPTASPDWRIIPVSYEPSTQYYFNRYQWAGTVGDQNNAGNGVIKFAYAYKKYFLANTPVSIPVQGNYINNENLMVLIDWDDVEPESAKLSTFTYAPNGENAATVTGFTPADEGGTYNVVLPMGTTSVTVNAKTVATLANVTKIPENGIVDVSTGSGTYTMTVQSGAFQYDYTINFTVNDKSGNAKLSGLTYTADNGEPVAVPGFLPTDNGGTYTVSLPEGVHNTTIQGVVADTGKATISYNKDALTTFGGSIVASVTAEDGTEKDYTVCFDVPGYIINDEFDRHGEVGELIAKKLGDWLYASQVLDGGVYKEYIVVGLDPKDPTNKVAQYKTDYSATKWPCLKKDAAFTTTTVEGQTVWSPLVITGETLLNKSAMNAYLELRKKGSVSGTGAEKNPIGFTNGKISFLGVDTGYSWTPNEWIKYSITIIPNPLDTPENKANPDIKTEIRGMVTGNGLTDANNNPVSAIPLKGSMKM